MIKLKVGDGGQRQTDAGYLFYGVNNVGKSFLAGRALASHSGPTLYIATHDEPYEATLVGAGLTGVDAVVLSAYDDIDGVIKDYHAAGLEAIVIDSAQGIGELALDSVTRGARMPGQGTDSKGKGVDGRTEWFDIKFRTMRAIRRLRKLAPTSYVVCAAHINTDEVSNKRTISPALFGTLAQEIIGKFTFVGYLEVIQTSPTAIQRQLHFETIPGINTRANVQRAFTGPIDVPLGLDAWTKVQAAINAQNVTK